MFQQEKEEGGNLRRICCDFIELSKSLFFSPPTTIQGQSRQMLGWCLMSKTLAGKEHFSCRDARMLSGRGGMREQQKWPELSYQSSHRLLGEGSRSLITEVGPCIPHCTGDDPVLAKNH
jgi:hypothetical protein